MIHFGRENQNVILSFTKCNLALIYFSISRNCDLVGQEILEKAILEEKRGKKREKKEKKKYFILCYKYHGRRICRNFVIKELVIQILIDLEQYLSMSN